MVMPMLYRMQCTVPFPGSDIKRRLVEMLRDMYEGGCHRREQLLSISFDIPESSEELARAIASSQLSEVDIEVDPAQFVVSKSPLRADFT